LEVNITRLAELANHCRPIVGIDAFDLRESEIDITPFLPVLLDGKSHTFEIRVASINDDGKGHATISEVPGSYWLVSGKIFLFLGKEGSKTTGTKPKISASDPSFVISSSVTQDSTGANETLTYSTTAKRSISISSTITTSSGTRAVSWTQSLSYNNYNKLTSQGLVQYTLQGTQASDSAPGAGYYHTYSYPLNTTTSYAQTETTLSLNGTIVRGLDLTTLGPAVFPSGVQNFNLTNSPAGLLVITTGGGSQGPRAQQVVLPALSAFQGSKLSTTQTGDAYYLSAGNGSYSYGSTGQKFTFAGLAPGGGVSTELYSRDVQSVNNTIVSDHQNLAGQTFGVPTGTSGKLGQIPQAEGLSVKAILGRGKGGNPKAIT
jgi:hypothetical protein